MAIEAHMFFKTLTCILSLLVVGEGGYIFLHRQPINRFKPIDNDGYVAFDTASGQLCRTFRSKSAPKRIESTPSSDRSTDNRSGDAVLDFIREGGAKVQAEENVNVQFILGLPPCRDIR
jgi:hypothetical protein